jgi:hypothetical protein
VQKVANATQVLLVLADLDAFVGLGDCRQVQVDPAPALENMASEVIDVQTLHDEDDGAAALVIQARNHGLVQPASTPVANRLRHGVGRLQRIVDDDDFGATPRQDAIDRRGQPASAFRRLELRVGILLP